MKNLLLLLLLTTATQQFFASEKERSRSTSPETEVIIENALQEIETIRNNKKTTTQPTEPYTTVLTPKNHGTGYCIAYAVYQDSFKRSAQAHAQLEELKEKHGPRKCVNKVLYDNNQKMIINYQKTNDELRATIAAEIEKREKEAAAIQQEIADLKTNHLDGKCISKERHEQEITTAKAEIKQPSSNTPGLLLTAGGTALVVSFMMHSRYHLGNFSWIDTVLPWNYLNLR